MLSEVADNSSLDDTLGRIEQWRATLCELDYAKAYGIIADCVRDDPINTWHEVVRSHSGLFMKSVHSAGKTAEMADLLDCLHAIHPDIVHVPPRRGAEALRINKVQRQANLDKQLPSLVLVAQGKSGSAAFANIVPQGFGLTLLTYSMITLAVIPSWAREFARGGAAYTTHLWPHARNIDILLAAGLNKAVVQTRDPRQIYLSFLHHQDRYRGDFPDKEKQGYYDLAFADRALLDLEYYDFIVKWLAGWVAAEDKGLTILFTTFEQFLDDAQVATRRIIDFYGADEKFFDANAAFYKSDGVDYHFRRGEKEEWRRAFAPRLCKSLNDRLPPSWFEKFGWNP